jgi:hypothetical protein
MGKSSWPFNGQIPAGIYSPMKTGREMIAAHLEILPLISGPLAALASRALAEGSLRVR